MHAAQLLDCDVVVLPDATVTERALAVSDLLQDYGAYFRLSPAGPVAHVSLYMFRFQEKDLGQVREHLAAIAGNTETIALKARRYNQTYGYIDAEYQRSPALATLQMALVTALNPLRAGLRDRDREYLSYAKGLKRHNLEQYGFGSVGESYRPHLTFTRLTDDRPIATNKLPQISAFNGAGVRLALFELGEHGTCRTKLAEFAFLRSTAPV